MNLEENFKLLVSGYYGIYEIDEYPLKLYVLKDVERYIRDFVNKEYKEIDFDYEKILRELEVVPLKVKLHDSLYVLNKIKGPLDLVILIKNKIKNEWFVIHFLIMIK